jgi:hypothetical protein
VRRVDGAPATGEQPTGRVQPTGNWDDQTDKQPPPVEA